ncbi:MAG: 4Fe-4S dicluster domain-containing protein [Mucispirillum sp.]|nr:4Fe-4S dicluster domain-containing protein [Mucispirillum sp.]
MKANSVLRGKIYRLLQFIVVACVFIIPFIKTSNGNSLFRFDVSTLQLFAFNGIVNFASFFSAFIAILLVTFLFIFTTQLLGRIWCGWLCPQSFFAIRIESYAKKIKNKSMRPIAEIILAAVFALLLTLIWMMYFVSPYDFIDTLKSSHLMLLIGIVLFLFIFVDFAFIRFKWCKYVCPYSKFQVVMTDDDTLYVGMIPGKESQCLDCKACLRVCPTHIDPRKNPDADCIYCETCVTACNKVFHKKENTNGILGYVWGKGDKLNLKRPNLIVTFIISISLFFVLIYSIVSTSEPVMIDIDSNVSSLGNGVYTCNVEIKNNLDKPVRVKFVNPDNLAEITPEMVRVYIQSTKTETITINTKGDIPNGKLTVNAYYDRHKPPLTFELNIK